MNPTRKNLPELPRIVAHDVLTPAVNRHFDDDSWSAMTAVSRSAIDQASHKLVQPRHIESPVLHADVDVVGKRLSH